MVSFVLYAAIGVWFEGFKIVFEQKGDSASTDSLITAIATYSPAIMGSCLMQLSISEAPRSLKAMGFIVAPAIFLLSTLLIFNTKISDWFAILIGLLASAITLAWWWIVNADELAFRDDPSPDAATGGIDPAAPLLGSDVLGDYQ